MIQNQINYIKMGLNYNVKGSGVQDKDLRLL